MVLRKHAALSCIACLLIVFGAGACNVTSHDQLNSASEEGLEASRSADPVREQTSPTTAWAIEDECLICHSDMVALILTADPEEEVEISEDEDG